MPYAPEGATGIIIKKKIQLANIPVATASVSVARCFYFHRSERAIIIFVI
jgi:hypothetical protein